MEFMEQGCTPYCTCDGTLPSTYEAANTQICEVNMSYYHPTRMNY